MGKAFFFKLIFFGFFFRFFPLSRSSFLFLLSSPLPVPLLSLSLSLYFFLSRLSHTHATKKEHVGGAMVETTGLRFAPSLLSVMVSAFEGRAEGINFEPRLIYIQPMGANAQPQGVDVQVRFLLVFLVFFFLSRAAAAIKKKKGNKKRYETHFFLLTFLFFSLSRSPTRLSSDNNSTLSPSRRSSTSVPWAPTSSPRGSTSRCVVFLSVFVSFFRFHLLFLSLSHLFLFPSSRFIFVQPNHNKNSPSSTP